MIKILGWGRNTYSQGDCVQLRQVVDDCEYNYVVLTNKNNTAHFYVKEVGTNKTLLSYFTDMTPECGPIPTLLKLSKGLYLYYIKVQNDSLPVITNAVSDTKYYAGDDFVLYIGNISAPISKPDSAEMLYKANIKLLEIYTNAGDLYA